MTDSRLPSTRWLYAHWAGLVVCLTSLWLIIVVNPKSPIWDVVLSALVGGSVLLTLGVFCEQEKILRQMAGSCRSGGATRCGTAALAERTQQALRGLGLPMTDDTTPANLAKTIQQLLDHTQRLAREVKDLRSELEETQTEFDTVQAALAAAEERAQGARQTIATVQSALTQLLESPSEPVPPTDSEEIAHQLDDVRVRLQAYQECKNRVRELESLRLIDRSELERLTRVMERAEYQEQRLRQVQNEIVLQIQSAAQRLRELQEFCYTAVEAGSAEPPGTPENK